MGHPHKPADGDDSVSSALISVLLGLAFVILVGAVALYFDARALCDSPDTSCSDPRILIGGGIGASVCVIFVLLILADDRRAQRLERVERESHEGDLPRP